jgi:hypothetical protein
LTTGHEIRFDALRNVRAGLCRVTAPLRSRFTEVIVDEAQDCSATDLALLEAISHAVPLVIVADPDQAIYGWNHADPARLLRLRDALGTPIWLTGNRRSAPAVCALAATVREGDRPADISVTRTHGPAVHLVPTSFGKAGKATHYRSGQDLVDLVVALAYSDRESARGTPSVLVLARKHAQLPPTVRRAEPDSNPITRLARAHQCVHSGSAPSLELDQACGQAEHALLGYWYPEQAGSVATICRTVGLEPAALRRHAYAFLHALPALSTEWTTHVNASLKGWWRPPGAAPSGGRGLFRGKVATIGAALPQRPLVRLTTVHQAKGDEADVVCVLMPDHELITRWCSGGAMTTEEREELRVFYVAVTRARNLLFLAVAHESLSVVQGFLSQRDVPLHICD